LIAQPSTAVRLRPGGEPTDPAIRDFIERSVRSNCKFFAVGSGFRCGTAPLA
jgi:hypothetical protein